MTTTLDKMLREDEGFQRTFAEESAVFDATELIAGLMRMQQITTGELAARLGCTEKALVDLLRGTKADLRFIAAVLFFLGVKLKLTTEVIYATQDAS
jgi:hypothetical protein